MSREQEKAVLSDVRRQGCNTDPDIPLCCAQVNFSSRFGTKSLGFPSSTPAKNPLWPVLPMVPAEHQRQHMATASCFSSFLRFSFSPGGAGAWMKAEARPYGTAANATTFPPGRPQAVWMHQLRGWRQPRAKQVQPWDTGWCWGNQNCQHME